MSTLLQAAGFSHFRIVEYEMDKELKGDDYFLINNNAITPFIILYL
tara:strand:+ start:211 stop:348 length:138 start_codon:yes stop_codon:yes gene_type:complete